MLMTDHKMVITTLKLLLLLKTRITSHLRWLAEMYLLFFFSYFKCVSFVIGIRLFNLSNLHFSGKLESLLPLYVVIFSRNILVCLVMLTTRKLLQSVIHHHFMLIYLLMTKNFLKPIIF